MAARICRLVSPSLIRKTVAFSQYGQRGFKFAGRITVSSPVGLTMSLSQHMSVFSKTSLISRPNSATSIFNVFVRQLFTQLRSRINHNTTVGLSLTTSKLTLAPIGKLPGVYYSRSINTCSKLGKRKTCKAVAKRFLRTGKGKLKRWRAGKSHNMMSKGKKRSRQLRKPTYVSKQQLKLLNKMLNGW